MSYYASLIKQIEVSNERAMQTVRPGYCLRHLSIFNLIRLVTSEVSYLGEVEVRGRVAVVLPLYPVKRRNKRSTVITHLIPAVEHMI